MQSLVFPLPLALQRIMILLSKENEKLKSEREAK
jgi:hypothetical protein